MTSCARPSRDGISEIAPHTTFFYHYGAHGGPKPEHYLRQWVGQASKAERGGGGCSASLVGAVANNWPLLEGMGR